MGGLKKKKTLWRGSSSEYTIKMEETIGAEKEKMEEIER